MTRPLSVPGVRAVISTENSSEPVCGTGKFCELIRMYFRWSNTPKSYDVVNGEAFTVIELLLSAVLPSPGPYGSDSMRRRNWPDLSSRTSPSS